MAKTKRVANCDEQLAAGAKADAAPTSSLSRPSTPVVWSVEEGYAAAADDAHRRKSRALPLFRNLVILCVGVVGILLIVRWSLRETDQPTAVAANSAQVHRGFRGKSHPLLSRGASLEVVANWSPVGSGKGLELGYFPAHFYGPFQDLAVREKRRTYAARSFSVFLPQELPAVGEIWDLDFKGVTRFLQQFHSTASLQLVAAGRRAGPNGAFAVLQGKSPEYLDIAFRVHAEFSPDDDAWYTPAYFAGRMLVNRQSGNVELFRMGIPTEKTLNATITVRLESEALIDIVHIDRMELVGGDPQAAAALEWVEAIEPAESSARLENTYYRFKQINWVPLEEAQIQARQRGAPILAIVLWGSLDDQSC